MWTKGWRKRIWQDIAQPWDIVIVGGGITGAGILAEATNRGYKALLVEAKDFGYGTSSRSSKLVHGGLRYMRQAQFHLTYESVRERDRLLREAEGLVKPLGVYGACLYGDKTPAWVFGLGLSIYDVFSRRWKHTKLSAKELQKQEPSLSENPRIYRGYHYHDAQTDDSRLVLRVLREAVAQGGTAINYAPAIDLLKQQNGRVTGVILRDDAATGETYEIHASIVINAAGIWSDQLRQALGKTKRLRAIRGSHLVFPQSKFPLRSSVTFFHPRDNRAVLAIPWEGVTLLGTTDEDHREELSKEPRITAKEAEYLAELLPHTFPHLRLTLDDVMATYAGIRPVVNTGKTNPSKESREHALWWENGLLTIAGGKLTTFRLMAIQALNRVQKELPQRKRNKSRFQFSPSTIQASSFDQQILRLQGRYGQEASEILHDGAHEETPIAGTTFDWKELRWSASQEGIVHLEDLMLRRLRLGLLLPHGGADLLPQIRQEIQSILEWSDAKWQEEETAYLETWKASYQLSPSH